MKVSNQALNKLFEEEVLRIIREAGEKIEVQLQLFDIYRRSKFIPDEVRIKKKYIKILTDMEGLMIGSGIPVKQDDYITKWNYKAHRTKLMVEKYKCEVKTITKFII